MSDGTRIDGSEMHFWERIFRDPRYCSYCGEAVIQGRFKWVAYDQDTGATINKDISGYMCSSLMDYNIQIGAHLKSPYYISRKYFIPL
jgi:hypothetical protein